jgi:imidazolonepropionase-like amidohydrolase
MSAPPGWPPPRLPRERHNDHWLIVGQQRAQAALAAGVTTVRDCGSASLTNVSLRESRDAGYWIGPRIFACGLPLTTTGGHLHGFGLRCDSAEELRRGVRWNAEHQADFIKIALTGGMSTPGSNPGRAQYSIDELNSAVEDAHRLGLKVAVHALSTEGVRIAAAARVDTLEHGWTVTGQAQDFETAVVGAVAEAGLFASVTAHRHLRAFLPTDSNPGNPEEIIRRLTPHRALRAAGVPVVVHSDSDGVKNVFSDFAQSVEVFQIGMGCNTPEAIAAATHLPATAIGAADRLGALCPGMLADVLVVQGRVSSDIRSLRMVRDVFLDGRPVVSNQMLARPAATV